MDKSNQDEFRSSANKGSAFISGITFPPTEVTYNIIDGMAIFEGDIILGDAEQLKKSSDDLEQGTGIIGQRFRWPRGIVPYDIDPNLPNQNRVTDAIAHWEANTPIRFVLRNQSNASQFPNFAHFRPGDGCSSFVGMQGTGSQDIFLGNGCSTGNAIHEIGHTVGLWHEQSRRDRDNFVRIVFQNIDPHQTDNFLQHITDGQDIGQYDYCSIMHYPATAFSTNGQPTIQVLHPELPCGNAIGQRNGLSDGDKSAIASLYFPFVMAWKGIDNDQGIWFSSFDGSNWAPQQNVSGVGTSVGPSLAVFNGRLFMAWKGIEGDQGIWFSSFDGSNWAPQQNVSGVGTSFRPNLTKY
jgi:hypothetical protein